jgi:drug/metabolite transporter (DMT)-like permease
MNNTRHVNTMNARRYLVLLVVVLGSTLGDVFLSRGMKQIGHITMSNWRDLTLAITNPWVVLGTLLLIAFFASYLSALSWADLSYIMLITAFGNVLTALLARFMLHEHIPFTRWTGILLITFGVSFVGRGPSLTVSDEPTGEPTGPASGGSKP